MSDKKAELYIPRKWYVPNAPPRLSLHCILQCYP